MKKKDQGVDATYDVSCRDREHDDHGVLDHLVR